MCVPRYQCALNCVVKVFVFLPLLALHLSSFCVSLICWFISGKIFYQQPYNSEKLPCTDRLIWYRYACKDMFHLATDTPLHVAIDTNSIFCLHLWRLKQKHNAIKSANCVQFDMLYVDVTLSHSQNKYLPFIHFWAIWKMNSHWSICWCYLSFNMLKQIRIWCETKSNKENFCVSVAYTHTQRQTVTQSHAFIHKMKWP